jgi:hypothetical protein
MLAPFIAQYGQRQEGEPKRLDKAPLVKRKQGGFDMLRDLHDLWLLVNESMMSLTVLEQAARALRDHQLLDVLKACRREMSVSGSGSEHESSRLRRRCSLSRSKKSTSWEHRGRYPI